MNKHSKKTASILQQSIWSSFIILFAGIVLGSLLIPVELDKFTQISVIVGAFGLFFFGVSLQVKRERKTIDDIDKLNESVANLENVSNPKS